MPSHRYRHDDAGKGNVGRKTLAYPRTLEEETKEPVRSVSVTYSYIPFTVAVDETRGQGSNVGASADEENDQEQERLEVEKGRLAISSAAVMRCSPCCATCLLRGLETVAIQQLQIRGKHPHDASGCVCGEKVPLAGYPAFWAEISVPEGLLFRNRNHLILSELGRLLNADRDHPMPPAKRGKGSPAKKKLSSLSSVSGSGPYW